MLSLWLLGRYLLSDRVTNYSMFELEPILYGCPRVNNPNYTTSFSHIIKATFFSLSSKLMRMMRCKFYNNVMSALQQIV